MPKILLKRPQFSVLGKVLMKISFFSLQTLWVISIVLVVSACGFRRDKSSGQVTTSQASSLFVDSTGRIIVPTTHAPGYSTVKSLIFQTKCIGCHGKDGGVNLETYGATTNALVELRIAILEEQSMPPQKRGGPLSANEQQLVRAWLDAGAPENDLAL